MSASNILQNFTSKFLNPIYDESTTGGLSGVNGLLVVLVRLLGATFLFVDAEIRESPFEQWTSRTWKLEEAACLMSFIDREYLVKVLNTCDGSYEDPTCLVQRVLNEHLADWETVASKINNTTSSGRTQAGPEMVIPSQDCMTSLNEVLRQHGEFQFVSFETDDGRMIQGFERQLEPKASAVLEIDSTWWSGRGFLVDNQEQDFQPYSANSDGARVSVWLSVVVERAAFGLVSDETLENSDDEKPKQKPTQKLNPLAVYMVIPGDEDSTSGPSIEAWRDMLLRVAGDGTGESDVHLHTDSKNIVKMWNEQGVKAEDQAVFERAVVVRRGLRWKDCNASVGTSKPSTSLAESLISALSSRTANTLDGASAAAHRDHGAPALSVDFSPRSQLIYSSMVWRIWDVIRSHREIFLDPEKTYRGNLFNNSQSRLRPEFSGKEAAWSLLFPIQSSHPRVRGTFADWRSKLYIDRGGIKLRARAPPPRLNLEQQATVKMEVEEPAVKMEGKEKRGRKRTGKAPVKHAAKRARTRCSTPPPDNGVGGTEALVLRPIDQRLLQVGTLMNHVHQRLFEQSEKLGLTRFWVGAMASGVLQSLIDHGVLELGNVAADGTCYWHSLGAFVGLNGEIVRRLMVGKLDKSWLGQPTYKRLLIERTASTVSNPEHLLECGLYAFGQESPWGLYGRGHVNPVDGRDPGTIWGNHPVLQWLAEAVLDCKVSVLRGRGSSARGQTPQKGSICLYHEDDNHFRPLGVGKEWEENLEEVATRCVDDLLAQWCQGLYDLLNEVGADYNESFSLHKLLEAVRGKGERLVRLTLPGQVRGHLTKSMTEQEEQDGVAVSTFHDIFERLPQVAPPQTTIDSDTE